MSSRTHFSILTDAVNYFIPLLLLGSQQPTEEFETVVRLLIRRGKRRITLFFVPPGHFVWFSAAKSISSRFNFNG